MARLRLQTQLLVSGLLMICVLTAAILLVLRYTIREQIAEQVSSKTDSAVQGFDALQRQFQLQLSRTAAVLAETPSLKALMAAREAITAQGHSIPFWRISGGDLFVLADPAGHVVGLHLTHDELDRQFVEERVASALRQGQNSAWWYTGKRLYWVFLRPITAGAEGAGKPLGTLAVGYEADSGFAEPLSYVSESKIVLTANGRILASPFAPEEESELQDRIADDEIVPHPGVRQVSVGEDRYEVELVTLEDHLPPPVQCYVFVSVTRWTALIRTLNRTIAVVGVTAIFLMFLLLHFVSGTITRPLENLVAAVRALAAGDYGYSITPRGSSEIAELGESFSKMRGELLASQQKQIEIERVAALGRAASFISHDLRHHLAAIVANAEFLHEADELRLDPDEIYGEIQAASERMTQMLDSLREWARTERNLSPAPASMEQTARRAADSVHARPEFRNHVLSVRATGEMAGVFDPGKMERAFLNLAVNACEALGEKHGEIVFDLSSTPDRFEIRISDNGPGIPASIRNTLFDPFVSEGKPDGTGLGLAIVGKIIHDHGGSIAVERTSEEGTTFVVKLPRFQRSTAAKWEDSLARK
ncbi:MAG: ATP-binding protein [Candidatus Acidiferrales bacterium]